jgi:hypothetical protein
MPPQFGILKKKNLFENACVRIEKTTAGSVLRVYESERKEAFYNEPKI